MVQRPVVAVHVLAIHKFLSYCACEAAAPEPVPSSSRHHSVLRGFLFRFGWLEQKLLLKIYHKVQKYTCLHFNQGFLVCHRSAYISYSLIQGSLLPEVESTGFLRYSCTFLLRLQAGNQFSLNKSYD